MADERLCLMQTAVGRHECCPGEACPYWQDGGCPLEQLRADIETNPELQGFCSTCERRSWAVASGGCSAGYPAAKRCLHPPAGAEAGSGQPPVAA